MKNKLIILLILLLSFSMGFPIQANLEQEKKGKLSADRLRYKKKENLRIATGNVVLDYQENHVTADKLEMYTENNILVFLGNANLKRPNETISSDLIELNLDQDQLEAKDNVVLDTKKNDKELYLTSGYLKLWLEEDNMLARENVKMDYDGQEIRGQDLEYNAKKDEMIVTKEAEIKEEDEWIKSDRIVVNLESGSIDATGQVEMEFEIEE